jgi:predicted dienelactone hydrolase
VRNNATRALAVLAAWVNRNPQAGVAIPPELFLDFLNSVSWTDRNKGLMVLMPLTASRDPALLAQLRSRALPSLVEMARWTNAGHALHPFLILARTAGLSDEDAFQAWQAGDREAVIARAIAAPGAQPPDDGQDLHVGMVTRAYVDPARRSWDRAGPRPLRTAIWYPAPRTSEMTEMVTAGLFIGGAVAPDAPIAGERRYPLILLSHGTGGSAVQMMWLGRFLAANGFVVAAVNHHGNTSSEPERRAEGFLLYWERARDLAGVLDQLLADDVFGPRINVERVGAAGFSLGGFTVLLTGGARFSREQYDAFCASTHRDFTCEPQPEHSTAHEEFARLRQSDPVVIEALRLSDESYRDPRVKAVFAIAPALGSGLTEASLAQMPVPVAVVVGNRDATTPMATNAARIAALVPGADYAVLSDVTHYTFLNACSTRGLELLDLCRDYASMDRSAIHRGVGEMALAFFRRVFDTGS